MLKRKPYGFEYHGKILRKWELPDGQARISEYSPGEEWHQVPLSFWDYSEHKVVEFERIEEVK